MIINKSRIKNKTYGLKRIIIERIKEISEAAFPIILDINIY
jgi:hypothetical protein